jgi:DNA-binding NarL/FixJ family response regulator
VLYSVAWSQRLDADHSRTLTHLVAGLTDRASANRLGVSERTVQRRIRDLMDWSASGNRMQLGRYAALAGLPDVHEHHDDALPPGCIPDAAGLRLLHLLLADAAAGRTLGLSPRSVERRVRELMTLAGARSRAQLGWRATRRGWL